MVENNDPRNHKVSEIKIFVPLGDVKIMTSRNKHLCHSTATTNILILPRIQRGVYLSYKGGVTMGVMKISTLSPDSE